MSEALKSVLKFADAEISRLRDENEKLRAEVERLRKALTEIVNEADNPSGCVIDGNEMGNIARQALASGEETKAVCPVCYGTGNHPSKGDGIHDYCDNCEGSGEIASGEGTRCAYCGWPYKADGGCQPGDCSQRPLPDRMMDEGRYRKEQNQRRSC